MTSLFPALALVLVSIALVLLFGALLITVVNVATDAALQRWRETREPVNRT